MKVTMTTGHAVWTSTSKPKEIMKVHSRP